MKTLFLQELKASLKVQGVSLTNEQINILYDVFVTQLKNTIKEHNRFNLSGFGTFKVVLRAGRNGRLPRNGEFISIPPKNTVAFKINQELKNSLNN